MGLGVAKGDKGRIETSLVPPWKGKREEIILFNKISNTNVITQIIYIAYQSDKQQFILKFV